MLSFNRSFYLINRLLTIKKNDVWSNIEVLKQHLYICLSLLTFEA